MRYNANEHPEPVDNFTPLPKGKYRVKIKLAQECDNANRTGKYLKVELDVLGPTHHGRKLWANMTTEHAASPQAVEIGLGQISAMARSIGYPSWDHESEIIGREGEVYVGFERDDPTKNRVTGWVVPAAGKGVPTYTAQHQAHAFVNPAARNAPLKEAIRGGAAAVPANRNPPIPPVSDMPDYLDDEIPF